MEKGSGNLRHAWWFGNTGRFSASVLRQYSDSTRRPRGKGDAWRRLGNKSDSCNMASVGMTGGLASAGGSSAMETVV